MKYNSKCHYIRIGGKCVATIRGQVLDIQKHKDHLIEKPPAIGISVETIRQAETMGVENIQVLIFETHQIYTCTLDHFKRFSFQQSRGGYEPQMFLALIYWIASMDVQSKAPKAGEVRTAKGSGKQIRNPRGFLRSQPAPRIEQLSLFK